MPSPSYSSVPSQNKMVQLRGGSAILILCLFLWVCITIGDDEVQRKKSSFLEWERLKGAYSIYSKLWSASSWQWQAFKTIVMDAYSRLFTPNLDFRKGGDEGEGEGGTGEKVKEALAKSIGKSKSTVEDSAKSAAEIAGETLHKTTQKVKNTLSNSDRDTDTQHQNEL